MSVRRSRSRSRTSRRAIRRTTERRMGLVYGRGRVRRLRARRTTSEFQRVTGMGIRFRTAPIVWLIGAVGLFLYPPIQGIAHTVPVDLEYAVPGEPTHPGPDRVFDAGMTMWRWDVA